MVVKFTGIGSLSYDPLSNQQ